MSHSWISNAYEGGVKVHEGHLGIETPIRQNKVGNKRQYQKNQLSLRQPVPDHRRRHSGHAGARPDQWNSLPTWSDGGI